jgi:hypothetical protein
MTVVALVAYIATLVTLVRTTVDLLVTPGAPTRKTD